MTGHIRRVGSAFCSRPTWALPSSSSSSLWSSPYFTQVVSDVDDTLKSSGGVNVAGVALGGIDVQYQRGVVYPGVMEFILQLSLGGLQATNRDDGPMLGPAKVAILTARAEEFKVALELKDDSSIAVKLRRAAAAYGITNDWGLGPVLYGSVAEWILQDRKGLRKFTNFERLIQQDPTGSILRYVYLGDTGELDQEAGETMLREYPELVEAVFLHVVSDDPGQCDGWIPVGNDNFLSGLHSREASVEIPIPAPRLINGRPLVFFRTYVGAAVAAVQLRLMSIEGLVSVTEAAARQLDELAATESTKRRPSPGTFQPINMEYQQSLDTRWRDLQRDMGLARELIGARTPAPRKSSLPYWRGIFNTPSYRSAKLK